MEYSFKPKGLVTGLHKYDGMGDCLLASDYATKEDDLHSLC